MAGTVESTLFFVELLVLLGCIFLGSRMGGMGIGLYGGVGMVLYGFGFQMIPGSIPFDVISIIMAVVSCIGCMQVAGGMDYMVSVSARGLRRFPTAITYVGGLVAFLLTVLAGTGHTSYSCLPVIAEVSKESGIRPSRALAAAVVGSMMGIAASPISAAVVWFSNALESLPTYAHTGYAQILAVMIPSCFLGLGVTCLVSSLLGKPLYDDYEFLLRCSDGRCTVKNPLPEYVNTRIALVRAGMPPREAARLKRPEDYETALHKYPAVTATAATPADLDDTIIAAPDRQSSNQSSPDDVVKDNSELAAKADDFDFSAKLSVAIFVSAIFLVVLYSLLISETIIPGWPAEKKKVGRNDAIVSVMVATSALICYCCSVDPVNVLRSSTFGAGMNGCICMLGVAWMGNTYVKAQMSLIAEVAGDAFASQAWLFPLIVFFMAGLLYSQASTAATLYPLAFDLQLSPLVVLGSYPAVCALFVLPIAPTTLAACQMDDTGTTRIGKYVFDHPFIIPGTAGCVSAIAIAFAIGSAVV